MHSASHTTCTATDCTAPATTERVHPNGDIDDLCARHAAEHDTVVAELTRD
jgi:hypothetical protein